MEKATSLIIELIGPIDGRAINLHVDTSLKDRLLSFLETETKRKVILGQVTILAETKILVVFEPTGELLRQFNLH